MDFNFFKKYPILKKWFLSKITYFSDELYSFTEHELVQNNTRPGRIIIIAKKHYAEYWKSFASVNKKELNKVINVKKNNLNKTNQIFQIFPNKTIDGFDVKTTIFDEEITEVFGNNKVLIPETELYQKYQLEQHIYQIETLNGLLFCGGHKNKLISSYAKGMILDVDTYKLSVGLPSNSESTYINKKQLSKFLITQLLNQHINKIMSKVYVNPISWVNKDKMHYLYWMPLLSALVFLIISNSVLLVKTNLIEEKVNNVKSNVSELLSKKQQYGHNVSVLNTLSNEFKDKILVHYYWGIIDQLLIKGMVITRVSFTKEKLIIRGSADKASEILEVITSHQQIENASFEGPVRKSRGKDVFILNILPKLNQNLGELLKENI